MALVTMPFFGPSLAGRSNSTTGTFTFTRWAAICAPITPAPSTATFFTWKRFVVIAFPSPAAGVPPGRCSWSLYMRVLSCSLPFGGGLGWGTPSAAASGSAPTLPSPRGGGKKPLLHPYPGLGAAERADGAAHFELLAAVDRRQSQRVLAAVLRVQDL